jgi:hypothetical protein
MRMFVCVFQGRNVWRSSGVWSREKSVSTQLARRLGSCRHSIWCNTENQVSKQCCNRNIPNIRGFCFEFVILYTLSELFVTFSDETSASSPFVDIRGTSTKYVSHSSHS